MKLLYISISTFLIVSSVSLAITPKVVVVKAEDQILTKVTYTTTPVLNQNALVPQYTAKSVLAVDLNSEEILYEKNPDSKVLPASTAKIFTALVSLDYYSPDEILEVKDPVIEGQKMGLKTGEKISVEELLNGLLIFSANDAAQVLAQNYPGGEDLFVAKMNLKAKELGLTNTYFLNPAGLDGVGQYTTARDLAAIAEYLMENEYLARIVGTKDYVAQSTDGKIQHKLKNINELLGKVDGVRGVKTGWTEDAMENLVTYVERGGKKVMISLLGSENRFGETENLIGWIFENYNWEVVAHSEGLLSTAP